MKKVQSFLNTYSQLNHYPLKTGTIDVRYNLIFENNIQHILVIEAL